MEAVYKIINTIWKFAKVLYESKPVTLEEWNAITEQASKLIGAEAEGSNERRLMVKILTAVIDYYYKEEWLKNGKNGNN